jgi:hypothetical protein
MNCNNQPNNLVSLFIELSLITAIQALTLNRIELHRDVICTDQYRWSIPGGIPTTVCGELIKTLCWARKASRQEVTNNNGKKYIVPAVNEEL